MADYPGWIPWAALVVGCLVLYLGAIYETQAKWVQNYFAALWVRIDDLSETGLRKQTAFEGRRWAHVGCD